MRGLIAQLGSILGKMARTATALRRPQTGPAGRRPLRKVSSEDLQEILEEHRKWVESSGTKGKKADLHECDLQKANLVEVNLESAELHGADLQNALLDSANLKGALLVKTNLQQAKLAGAKLAKANLTEANLKEANLFCADLSGASLPLAILQGASLSEANLREADLFKTVLRDANLQDADLSNVKGLLVGQLAGANVSGAKLPEAILKFEGLANVQEASKSASKLFISMLLGCFYAWLTIGITTDVALLTNSSSLPLPLIGTAIPIVGFYVLAPFILLSFYFYFHLYLQRLWEMLANLPAVFPDDRALDERAYPWLLNGLVRTYFVRLKENRPPLSRLQTGISMVLAWWIVPLTLFFFWLRYLRAQDWTVTPLHIVLLTIATGAALMLYRLAAATLRGGEELVFRTRIVKEIKIYNPAAVVIGILAALFLLSLGGTYGVPVGRFSGTDVRTWAPHPKVTDIRTWVPRLFKIVGYSPFADLREADVSTKPANWTGQTEEEFSLVKRAHLRKAKLRYALASRAFLVGADLRRADLGGAILNGADLREADLRNANLAEAVLFGAKLKGAKLSGAKLQGAKMTEVTGLTREQILSAYIDKKTQLPEDLHGLGK